MGEFERDRKPSTLRDYRTIARGHLLPGLGDLRLEDMTPDVLEDWKSRLRSPLDLGHVSRLNRARAARRVA